MEEPAAALYERAELELARGRLRSAAAALRRGVAIEPRSRGDRARRLEAMTRLGEVLERLGELDAAEDVLRQCLGQRAAFYGVEHPGYAFGLEPLAALELSRGRAAQARCLAEQALHVLFEAGHPRRAELVALRAFASVVEGSARSEPFAFVDALDDRQFEQMVRAVLDRSEWTDPRHALRALERLRPIASARRGDEDELLLHLVAAIANRAADAAEHGARAEALAWLVGVLDRRGDRVQALDALLGLALAASDAGDGAAAEGHYREALRRSKALSAAERSKVLRNYGHHRATTDPPAAEALLEAAVAEARAAHAGELLGRALVALGIFRQHAGQRTAARSLLKEGLGALAAIDPDAICARNHLDALNDDGECGCAHAAPRSTTRVISAGAPRRIGGPQ